MEKEFDIVKILRGLRDLKIISKKNMDPITKLEIYNAKKNVIDIDLPSDIAENHYSNSSSDENRQDLDPTHQISDFGSQTYQNHQSNHSQLNLVNNISILDQIQHSSQGLNN